jgi:hypothetical protein
MRRLTTALSLGLLALLILAAPVGAGVTWCRVDPIVRLNGTVVQILVAVPNQYVAAVNGPIAVDIATDRTVAHELLFTDAGFNGHGETVAFGNYVQYQPPRSLADNEFPVQIKISVPIDGLLLPVGGLPVPVEVTVIPDNGPPIVYYGTHLDASRVMIFRGSQ